VGCSSKVVQAERLGRCPQRGCGDVFTTAPTAFRESKKLLTQCFDLPYNRFLEAYLKGQKACLTSADMKYPVGHI